MKIYDIRSNEERKEYIILLIILHKNYIQITEIDNKKNWIKTYQLYTYKNTFYDNLPLQLIDAWEG